MTAEEQFSEELTRLRRVLASDEADRVTLLNLLATVNALAASSPAAKSGDTGPPGPPGPVGEPAIDLLSLRQEASDAHQEHYREQLRLEGRLALLDDLIAVLTSSTAVPDTGENAEGDKT